VEPRRGAGARRRQASEEGDERALGRARESRQCRRSGPGSCGPSALPLRAASCWNASPLRWHLAAEATQRVYCDAPRNDAGRSRVEGARCACVRGGSRRDEGRLRSRVGPAEGGSGRIPAGQRGLSATLPANRLRPPSVQGEALRSRGRWHRQPETRRAPGRGTRRRPTSRPPAPSSARTARASPTPRATTSATAGCAKRGSFPRMRWTATRASTTRSSPRWGSTRPRSISAGRRRGRGQLVERFRRALRQGLVGTLAVVLPTEPINGTARSAAAEPGPSTPVDPPCVARAPDGSARAARSARGVPARSGRRSGGSGSGRRPQRRRGPRRPLTNAPPGARPGAGSACSRCAVSGRIVRCRD
jgi:hypothetical protein